MDLSSGCLIPPTVATRSACLHAQQKSLPLLALIQKKWTYEVVPFGPVNGPQMFNTFIHPMDSTWEDLAQSVGLTIYDNTNTRIITNNILSWDRILSTSLLYMECQLRVFLSQNLLLSLKKTHIFLTRMEFVGIDVNQDGNHSVMYKHQLLRTGHRQLLFMILPA